MANMRALIIFAFACTVQVCYGQVTTTCTYNGHTYQQGDAWVDDRSCGTCVCNEYGAQCNGGLNGPCEFNSSVANPGDPACVYAFHSYLVGTTFKVLDGCNTCHCTSHGMQCTATACSPDGFARPSKEPLYGECLYNEGWYVMGSQWLALDGCNTCYCYSVGNYRGGHACTTTKCHGNVIQG